MIRAIIKAAVAAMVTTVTATGCTGGRSAVVPGSADTITSSNDLTLPLDSYDLDAQERAVVQRARGVLLRTCMTHYGFKVALPAQTPVLYPRNAAFLGWLGAKQVSRYGYSGPPGQLLEEASAANGLRPFPPIAGLQGAVFAGEVETVGGKRVPPGGCNAAAEKLLSRRAVSTDGSSPAPAFADRKLGSFAADAAERAYADDRLRAADQAWSACMRASGYVYDRPSGAREDPRWATRENEPAGATEKKTATADEKCRSATNYIGIRKMLYTDHQQRIIRDEESTLRWIAGLLRARLAMAHEVLDDRSGQLQSRWLRSLDEAT